MISLHQDERGSIPLVILMSIVVAGMLSVTFTILRQSTRAVASDRNFTFAIQVADLDAAVAELRAGGVDVGDPAPVGTGRQAFLHDPSGNMIELHQPV